MKHITLLTVFLLIVQILSFSVVISSDAVPISEITYSRGKIELISATQQGITLQLTIPKSAFEIKTLEHNGKQYQTLLFPGCRYTNESGSPRLPIQTALLGVPSDASFTVRIVESSDFSTYKLQHTLAAKEVIFGRYNSSGIALKQESRSNSTNATNRFFPQNLAKIGETGQIRENRVLPIQLNPVQYNPVSGIVKLYHRLVVEVQFSGVRNEPSTILGFPQSESSVYEELFGNLLINPQAAKQWRSPVMNAIPRDETVGHISPFSIPRAPAITTPRYKIYVLNSGMYSITASDLASAGVDITTIRPSTLALSNKGKQIPIYVRNAGSGKTVDDTSGFDSDGEIIFYAQRHSGEKTYFDPYTDQNVYWLSWNAGPGLRMETTLISTEIPEPTFDTSGFQTDGLTLYQPRNFLTRVHVEKDNQFRRFKNFGLERGREFSVFGDGILQRDFGINALPDLPDDSWFWAQTSATEIRNFPFMITGVAGTGQKATIRVALHGRSEGSHLTRMWLNNDIVLGSLEWTGDTEYRFVNQEISQSELKDGRNILSAVSPEEQELDLVLMNWFEIDYWRTFEANSNLLPFSITLLPDDVTGEVNPNFRVTLKNFTDPNIEIYGVDGTRYVGLAPKEDEDMPGIYEVVFQSTRIGGVPQYQLGESLNLDTSIQYIALTRGKYRKPQKIIKDTPTDLRGEHNGADYIIITDTEFMRDVQSLANFRSKQGLRSIVVDIQNIYDEFNHGITNPYAIRDFLKYAYENWQPPAPTYVLLVGDANPIDKTSYVPTIQVQIPGYGSSSSDHQFVTFRGADSFPDMLIGRVPVANSVDARIFVERAINYESTDQIGPWHKRILMLAGSTVDFHVQTDTLVEEGRLTEKYETKLIYAPTTVDDELPLGEGTTPVGRQVIDGFNDGASVVNYVGHGAGGRWASSRMMDLEDPHKNLTNISQLPFVISMTCFTGEFDSKTGCLAEEFLRSQSGGAIGVIGGTSVGLLLEDHILNKEIFKVIFNDKTPHLGAILAEAKTQFLLNLPGYLDLAEVFTLFGDPATRLRLPHTQMQLQVETDKVLHRDVFDAGTLLSVSGKLPDPNFSGEVEITVLPNPKDRGGKRKRTYYRSPPTTPRVMDDTPRMETVAVTGGQFNAQLQIPYNSAFESWDLRTYAWNSEEDAIGYTAYTTLNRYIKNVRLEPYPVPVDQPVHVSVDVINVSAIENITLYWSKDLLESRRDEAAPIPMVQHEGTTYRTEQPIPAYSSRILIDYYLLVKTKEGRILQTDVVTYTVGEAADLTVLENTISWETNAPYHLSAHIRNLGTIDAKNIPVRFFQMPATDESETQEVTLEMLQNATPIGEVRILPEIPPKGFVVANVPWKPDPGAYHVTVFVDMPSELQPNGIIAERRESNNSASRVFVNNRVFISTENIDKPIQSLDGMFRITIPPKSLDTHNAMTFETEPLTIKNQPDINHVPIGNEDSFPSAYRLEFSQPTELIGTATFVKTESDDLYIYTQDDETGNWLRIGKQIDDGETISAEVKLPGTFALLFHADSQPPSVEVSVENQGFIDGDYISDTPIITAKIEDANGIDPRPESIILTKNGGRVPQDEYTISASPTSSNIILITYSPINALEAGEYRIRLQAQDANGNLEDSTITAKVAGGFEIKNIANFPNPFRPGKGTDFAYYLTGGADKVSLKIYTLTGKLITTIDTLDASISYNEYHFDGLDADGDPLANGVYIYKFTATKGDTRAQKVGKIVVLK